MKLKLTMICSLYGCVKGGGVKALVAMRLVGIASERG